MFLGVVTYKAYTYENSVLLAFFQIKKIDEMAVERLQQTHELQSSGIFNKGLKIVSLGISVTY